MRSSCTAIWRLEQGGGGPGCQGPGTTLSGCPAVVRTLGGAGVKSPPGHEYQTRQPSPLCSGAPQVTHTPLAAIWRQAYLSCLSGLSGLSELPCSGLGWSFLAWPGGTPGAAGTGVAVACFLTWPGGVVLTVSVFLT